MFSTAGQFLKASCDQNQNLLVCCMNSYTGSYPSYWFLLEKKMFEVQEHVRQLLRVRVSPHSNVQASALVQKL